MKGNKKYQLSIRREKKAPVQAIRCAHKPFTGTFFTPFPINTTLLNFLLIPNRCPATHWKLTRRSVSAASLPQHSNCPGRKPERVIDRRVLCKQNSEKELYVPAQSFLEVAAQSCRIWLFAMLRRAKFRYKCILFFTVFSFMPNPCRHTLDKTAGKRHP